MSVLNDKDSFLKLESCEEIKPQFTPEKTHDRTRKQVSLRISEKALGDASDALADIATQLSKAQCLRVIVEALSFNDWEALVKNHERQIRRAVANTQRESKWKKK